MATKPVHKTVAELQAERALEVDAWQQANSQRTAAPAEKQREIDAFVQRAQAAREARAAAIERGEEPPKVVIPTFEQALLSSQAAHVAQERESRREIVASPEHQRLVEHMTMTLPQQHKAWVKDHINDGHEPSPAEAWAQLQDAKQGVDRANKQLAAVQGRTLSPAELAYAQRQVTMAEVAEAGALARFNELTDVAVPEPEPRKGISSDAMAARLAQGG
jgi:hypothetical protein